VIASELATIPCCWKRLIMSPHVAGHPARRKGSEPLLERCQIIAPIADLSAEHLGPDAGEIQ
jgi:hypothetical protein